MREGAEAGSSLTEYNIRGRADVQGRQAGGACVRKIPASSAYVSVGRSAGVACPSETVGRRGESKCPTFRADKYA